MAFSNILQKIFKSSGQGPEVNDGILSKDITIQSWSSTHNYLPGTLVKSNGGGASSKIYFAKQSTGPSESVGPQDPSLDTGNTYWSVVSVDDNGVVHKTGDTMTGDLRVPSLFFDYSLYKKHPEVTKGASPSEIKFWSIYNCDKNGTQYANNILGVVETTANPNGTVHTYIRAVKNEAGSQANGTIGVAYDTANNYAYTYAPTPTSLADNTNKIATTEWVRTATGNTALNAASAVKLANARKINGVSFNGTTDITIVDSTKVSKTGDTMTGDLKVPSLYFDYNICKKHPDVVKGTNPSELKIWSIYNCDKNGIDYANNMLGVVETSLTANGIVSTYMRAIKNQAGSQANGTLGVAYDTVNNYAYTFAPTPTATADNTSKIATTEWVRRATGDTLLNSSGLAIVVDLGSNYEMTASDFDYRAVGAWHVNSFKSNTSSVPSSDVGDYTLTRVYHGDTNYSCILCTSPRTNRIFYGHFWEGTWSGWNTLHTETINLQFEGNANAVLLSKDNDSLFLCGGTNIQSNSFIGLAGGTNSNSVTPGAFYIHAKTSSSTDKVLSGTPSGTLQWMGQPLQTTSDQRLKTKLESIPDEVLNAWGSVEWGQFQYLEAIDEKGKNARLHSGLVSQQVQNAFLEHNLDACSYGLICHETRDEVNEDIVIETLPAYTDNEGVFHPEEKVIDHHHEDAVDLWMIRYTEALCMEAAYNRREVKRLKERLSRLEERLAS